MGRCSGATGSDAGFPHLVLSLPAPFPVRVAHWVADELIAGARR